MGANEFANGEGGRPAPRAQYLHSTVLRRRDQRRRHGRLRERPAGLRLRRPTRTRDKSVQGDPYRRASSTSRDRAQPLGPTLRAVRQQRPRRRPQPRRACRAGETFTDAPGGHGVDARRRRHAMRRSRSQGGVSASASLIARWSCRRRRRTSASRRRSRSSHHYKVKAVFQTANNIRRTRSCASRASTSARSRRSSTPSDGKQAARRHDAHRATRACRSTRTRRSRSARASSSRATSSSTSSRARRRRRRSATATRSRSTRRSSPVQLDQILTVAAVRHAQATSSAARASSRPASASGGARGLQPLDPVLEARLPATARSSTTRTLGTEQHDLSRLHQERGRDRRGALDRNAEAAQVPHHRLQHDARRAFAREHASSRAPIAELPRTLRAGEPALAALNAAFPPLRRFDPRLSARPCAPRGPALDASLPFVRAAPRPRPSRRAARPGRATCARRCRALTQLEQAHVPLYEQVRAASSCQNEVILPWTQGQDPGPGLPGRSGRSTRSRPSRWPASPARAARATPTASGSASWSPRPNYAYPLGTGKFFLTGQPLKGVNPPPPRTTSAAAAPDVPVRDPAAARPALEPRRRAERRHRSARRASTSSRSRCRTRSHVRCRR